MGHSGPGYESLYPGARLGFTEPPGYATKTGPHRWLAGALVSSCLISVPAPHAGAAAGSKRSVEAKVQVQVRDNNVDQALRVLKKKLQREGVFREMKLRRSFEKPSARKKRERAEAVRRHRKLLRKRMEREGF